MKKKKFNSGRLRAISYDARARTLTGQLDDSTLNLCFLTRQDGIMHCNTIYRFLYARAPEFKFGHFIKLSI